MRGLLALPLSLDFSPSGHVRPSCVTATTRFSSKRAREALLRYRSHSIFLQAGTRGPPALPLPLVFSSSGHARPSCVTAPTRFSPKRAREALLRYRSHSFFLQAGTREPLALPLPLDFSPSGHARPSCVTAPTRFSPKRAREALLRYRSHSIFPSSGTLAPQRALTHTN
jgi:hypothetical protein